MEQLWSYAFQETGVVNLPNDIVGLQRLPQGMHAEVLIFDTIQMHIGVLFLYISKHNSI
jgi:hypothetical protein